MTHSGACPNCLRRSWLLSLVAPYIEKLHSTTLHRSVPEVLRLGNEDLLKAVAPKVASTLLDRVDAVGERHFYEELRAASCWATCPHDPLYPESLRGAADAPSALIARGEKALLADFERSKTVTVVGSRYATAYGREVARTLGHDLAAAGLTVVSGLSFGIDSRAHRGAIEAGRTIAVLGCGPDIAYPAAHRSLWRRIIEHGLVVSELAPGASPWRWTFLARNRIMAGLSAMTVVVEAVERSRSLVTADLAVGFGRELGAVPGPVTSVASVGTNNLLAGGAHVVRGAQDVLDVLLDDGR